MKETEYTVDALLKSKAFSQYQQDVYHQSCQGDT